MKHTPKFHWDYDLPSDEILEGLDWSIQKEVTDAFNLHVCCSMPELVRTNESTFNEVDEILNEMNYREVASMINPNFIKHAIRAEELQGSFFKKFEGDTMYFMVPSSEKAENNIDYLNMVEFLEWENLGTDSDLSTVERARMMMWVSDIKLHCTCPSFLFHGYEYLLTVMDAAIYPEERKPVIKNPSELGIVCKHLNRTLRVLPFFMGDMSTAIKQQFG